MPSALAPLEDDRTADTERGVLRLRSRSRVLFGSDAISAYVGQAEGRLMRALKTILGSPLIDEKTSLGSRKVPLTEVVEIFVRHLKHKAEAFAGQEITAVVHGRPVRFVDGDEAADARAQAVLETIARQVGFRDVAFVYEPIAAAWHYEQTVQAEELVLIADIGGGTSDFSVVRIGPQRRGRADRSPATSWRRRRARVGGTDFDSALSLAAVMPLLGLGTQLVEKDLPMPNALYHELATWATINFAYTYKNEREVAELVLEALRAGEGRAAPDGDAASAWAIAWPSRSRTPRSRSAPSTHAAVSLDFRRGRPCWPRQRAPISSARSGRQDRSAVQDGPRLHRRGGPRRALRSTRSSSPADRAACRPCVRRSRRLRRPHGLADGFGPPVRGIGADTNGGAGGVICAADL